MTLQDNFNQHSKQYIFSDDEFLISEREKIYKKIYSNKFDKRNNESLKNINFSDLNSFNYYFQTSSEKPSVNLLEKNVYEITPLVEHQYDCNKSGICKIEFIESCYRL